MILAVILGCITADPPPDVRVVCTDDNDVPTYSGTCPEGGAHLAVLPDRPGVHYVCLVYQPVPHVRDEIDASRCYVGTSVPTTRGATP